MSAAAFELLEELADFLQNKSPTAAKLAAILDGNPIVTDAQPETLAPTVPFPHVILYELESQAEEGLSGPSDLEHTTVQIACRADQPSVAANMRRLIRSALHPFRGYLTNIFVSNVSLVSRARHADQSVEGDAVLKRASIVEFKISHSVPQPAIS